MFDRTIASTLGALLVPAVASAEDAFEKLPLKSQQEPSTLVPWAIAAVFIIGCLVVAFKPSKRSNLR